MNPCKKKVHFAFIYLHFAFILVNFHFGQFSSLMLKRVRLFLGVNVNNT